MQCHEKIRFRDEECSLCTAPLAQAIGSVISEPPFGGFSTACRRGYVGEWEIRDDQLFLTGLGSPLWGSNDRVAVGDLFPGAPPDGVFVAWCTDWLHVPKMEYMWLGLTHWEPVSEWDVFLAVHRGRMIAVHDVTNTDPPVMVRELTPRLEEAFPEEAPFIRALHINWTDRLPRLVYADWLDERNDARGELLRVDVELEKSPSDAGLLARRKVVLKTVKDWFWMKLVGCDPPRNERGWAQRTW